MSQFWDRVCRLWAQVGPPLRPDREVVAAFSRLVRDRESATLQFGVTPELSGLCAPLLAIDGSEAMIRHFWPGNAQGRHAVLGDWLAVPAPDAAFTNCMGDGSANVFNFPRQTDRFFAEVKRILHPEGCGVFRVFCAPESGCTVQEIFRAAERGGIDSFHTFKFRVAMAVAHETGNPNVPVARVREIILAEYGDHAGLAECTGWPLGDIETLEYYEGSATRLAFPKRREVLDLARQHFPAARTEESGTYEPVESFPMLVLPGE